MEKSIESRDNKELKAYLKDLVEDLDYEISSTLQKWRTKAGNWFWRGISVIGYPYIWTAVAILFSIFDLFHVAYVIMFSGLTSLITFPLKSHFRRKRPFKTYKDIIPLNRVKEKDFSFPSGHTYNATVTSVSLALCYGGIISLLLMVGLAILVAVSRIYLGVHYLSDVAVGFILGLIFAFVVFLFFPYILVLHNLTLN